MLIGLGVDMTCIDVLCTRSKVKVTRVLCVKRGFAHVLRIICYRASILLMMIGTGEDINPMDFGFA